MKIVIDMMGGDNSLKTTIPATKLFLEKHSDLELFLIGNLNDLNEFKQYKNVTLIESKTIVAMDVDPLTAIRDKESSLMVAIKAFLDNGCDALISAGSTAALLTAATLKIKRIQGIVRPCLVTSFPTLKDNKKFVTCDLGANTTCTKDELVQFAIMGSIYYKSIYNDSDFPRVFLLNNGTEEEKGTDLNKETYPLLKECDKINFQGNMEARDPLKGELEVLVCDGYSGNIFLKTMEGTAKSMSTMIKEVFTKNIFTKISYLFVKSGISKMKEKMDYKNVGGALLAGVNGVVIKAHGSSDSRCFLSALENGYKLVNNDIVNKIKENI